MKILITGGTGFVGSRLCDYFSASDDVISFSRKAGYGQESYDTISESMYQADAVIHCAAITEWFGPGDLFHEINELWPSVLAGQAAQQGVKVFVYLSSIAVYGYWNHKRTIREDDVRLTFLNRLRMTDYGISKIKAENNLNAVTGIRSVIFRCGLVYNDERFQTQKKNTFPNAVMQARMPYIHIENVCTAVKHVLHNEKTSGVYNLVDDEQPYVAQLADSYAGYTKQDAYKQAAKVFVQRIVKQDRKALRVAWNALDTACRCNSYSVYRLKSTGYRPHVRFQINDEIDNQQQGCPMELAMVGCGEWGAGLLKKLQPISRFKVRAICDPVISRSAGGIPAYNNIVDMLALHHFDGVIISTPNHLHLEHVHLLAPYVRNLYVEKPICSSNAEWTELKSIVDTQSLCITVGHSVSYGRMASHIRKEIIGRKVRMVRMVRTVPGNHVAEDWRKSPKLCPGGVIPQLAVHLFDVAHSFFPVFRVVGVEVLERLNTGQVWQATVEGMADSSPVTLTVGFGKENHFMIEITYDDNSKILWEDGIYTDPSGERFVIPFDDGFEVLLGRFYSKWFRFESGLSEHDVKVQQSYLRSLGFIEALSHE